MPINNKIKLPLTPGKIKAEIAMTPQIKTQIKLLVPSAGLSLKDKTRWVGGVYCLNLFAMIEK